MRVIAGTLKGRRLEPPTWDGLRPTSDKLRETLFNVLAPRSRGARARRLCGHRRPRYRGASAAARDVTFVEQDRRAQRAHRDEPRALRDRERLCYHPARRSAGDRQRSRAAARRSTSSCSIRRIIGTTALTRRRCRRAQHCSRRAGVIVLEHARRRAVARTCAAGSLARVPCIVRATRAVVLPATAALTL